MDRLGLHAADRLVTVQSPAGDLFVAFNDAGISAVMPAALFDDDPAQFAARHREETGRPLVGSHGPARRPGCAAALRTGRATSLRYDLSGLTPFERAVLTKTLEIPLGRGAALRMGGTRDRPPHGPCGPWARRWGAIPCPCSSPCHRVVRSDGQIGNYGLGVPMKRALLSAEGVDIERLERLADAGVRFVGSDTTGVFCVPSCVHARRIRAAHEVRFRTAAGGPRRRVPALLALRPGGGARTRRSRALRRRPRRGRANDRLTPCCGG